MKPTFNDPVAEIRAVRQELAERFGGDVNALCDFLVEREKLHEELLVNYPPRTPPHPPRETT
ncbi:MAG: hypothetical protein ACRDRL_25620 [Sciscionella sp.]